jgi:hypothetical protein
MVDAADTVLPLLEVGRAPALPVHKETNHSNARECEHATNDDQCSCPARKAASCNPVGVGVAPIILTVKAKKATWAITIHAITRARAIIHAIHAILEDAEKVERKGGGCMSMLEREA